MLSGFIFIIYILNFSSFIFSFWFFLPHFLSAADEHLNYFLYVIATKLLQSCPTLCDPIDRSPPDFPVLGILQARTLEWVAISFSNA